MQTRTKESKKRLHSLILLTAFTAVLLIVSTYAWFTTQKSVSIANIKGKVQVAEGLEISLDGEKWTQTLNLDDTTYVSLTAQNPNNPGSAAQATYDKLIYKPYEGHENNVPGEFKPVSTSGETFVGVTDLTENDLTAENRDKLVMLAGDYDGELLTNVNLCKDLGGDYFAFDVFIRNSSKSGSDADILQLNHTSSAWVVPDGTDVNDPVLQGWENFKGNPKYGIQNTVRVGFARYGASEAYKKDEAGEYILVNNEKTAAPYFLDADASAKKIIEDTNKMPITGVAIWEPNSNSHSEYAVENTKILFDRAIGKEDEEQDIYLTDQVNNKFFTKTLNFASLDPSTGIKGNKGINVFDWDNDDEEPYKTSLNYLHTTQTRAVDETIIDESTNTILRADERFPMIEDGVQNLKLVETTDSPNIIDLKDENDVNTNRLTADGNYVDFKKLNTQDLTIAANSITKFRIYIWIEGQDPDCTNYASSGGGIEVNLSLCKGQDEGEITTVIESEDRVTQCLPGTCIDGDRDDNSTWDGRCDTCGNIVTCEYFGGKCVEDPDSRDGICDYCGTEKTCEYFRTNASEEDKELFVCIDETGPNGRPDTKCDICEAKVNCAKHIDEYDNLSNEEKRDSRCDTCGISLECNEYAALYENDTDTYYCYDSADADGNYDALCDICGKNIKCSDSIDVDKVHNVDINGDDIVCYDTFTNGTTDRVKDNLCDRCGNEMPEVEEGN